eukprot:3763455-Karenia_brevis.AAC.1
MVRLSEEDDSEIVLRERPLSLQIEVPSGNSLMPVINGVKIYTLHVERRQWALDKAGCIKILRFGFTIVPDFGGTAHAYCGTTLDACIGDLLP